MIEVPTAPWAHYLFDAAAWATSVAVGAGLQRWRLRAATRRIALAVGPGYFAALVGGAVISAWVFGSLNTLRAATPSLSHSVVGALVGAIAGVEIYKRWRGVEGSTGVLFAGPFAAGLVVGRFGCLFAGLPDATYGAPSALPWAVDLGDGVGRHPVQLYESAAMAGFLGVYVAGLGRNAPWAMRRGFYALCIWYGVQRFAWEFLKPYPPVLGPLNLFQILCGGLVVYGWIYWRSDLERERRAQERALPVPGADHQPV